MQVIREETWITNSILTIKTYKFYKIKFKINLELHAKRFL